MPCLMFCIFEFEVLLLLTVTDICYKTAEWLLLDVGYRI